MPVEELFSPPSGPTSEAAGITVYLSGAVPSKDRGVTVAGPSEDHAMLPGTHVAAQALGSTGFSLVCGSFIR